MPAYRAVSVGINSQFDVAQLPEYAPPDRNGFPKLQDNDIVSVYVPVLPGSQFWICYSVDEPDPSFAYFYFKLFLNGAHIISWGVGKKEEYKGKTMFAMYDAAEIWTVKNIATEKRGFFFSMTDGAGSDHSTKNQRQLEIRVYRARGRQRTAKDMEQYGRTAHGRKGPDGLEMMPIGQIKKDQPRRFYKYALADPVDKPFATFRYHYRTWEELDHLGILRANEGSDESGISVVWHDSQEDIHNLDGAGSKQEKQEQESSPDRRKEVPCGSGKLENDDVEDDKFGFIGRWKRLSIPPSQRLFPTTNSSFPVPAAPKGAGDSTVSLDPVNSETWLSRTPSPIKGDFRDIDSPIPGRKRSHAGDILREVVENALKRKEKP